MARQYKACLTKVLIGSTPPVSFLDELVDWGSNAPDEIFGPNSISLYSSVGAQFGPYERSRVWRGCDESGIVGRRLRAPSVRSLSHEQKDALIAAVMTQVASRRLGSPSLRRSWGCRPRRLKVQRSAVEGSEAVGCSAPKDKAKPHARGASSLIPTRPRSAKSGRRCQGCGTDVSDVAQSLSRVVHRIRRIQPRGRDSLYGDVAWSRSARFGTRGLRFMAGLRQAIELAIGEEDLAARARWPLFRDRKPASRMERARHAAGLPGRTVVFCSGAGGGRAPSDRPALCRSGVGLGRSAPRSLDRTGMAARWAEAKA